LSSGSRRAASAVPTSRLSPLCPPVMVMVTSSAAPSSPSDRTRVTGARGQRGGPAGGVLRSLPILRGRRRVALRADALHRDGAPTGRVRGTAVVPARHAFALPDERDEKAMQRWSNRSRSGCTAIHSAEVRQGEGCAGRGRRRGRPHHGCVGTFRSARGASPAIDPDPERRESARSMGATDVVASVAEADVAGYDVALECVGRPELLQACQAAIRPTDASSSPAHAQSRRRSIRSPPCFKELTIRYSVCYTPSEFRDGDNRFQHRRNRPDRDESDPRSGSTK